MNHFVHTFIADICSNAPMGNKESVIKYSLSKYQLIRDRKVYYCKYFAVRFNFSRDGRFNGTVLSLSALQKYDRIPFLVVLVRGNGSNVIYLANSTFISKISHSSEGLTMTNITGSFNGSNIMKSYNDITNSPDNFDELFALHEGLDWEDNLLRLVDASSQIRPRSQKFTPSETQRNNIFDSVARAKSFIQTESLTLLTADLNERCNKSREAIMVASHIENSNIRGRIIEFLITSNDETRGQLTTILKDELSLLPEFTTYDDLWDYDRGFYNGHTYTDIKTKIIYLDSAPKAYNVDKFLQKMADTDSIFFFFLIGIGENDIINTALCSVYHTELLNCSIVQHHWAGRSTRGVVQFDGKTLNSILGNKDFSNIINPKQAHDFLESLLKR